MTVLLDAYAVVAYLTDETAAGAVQELLWDGEVAISVVQVAEVVDRLIRVQGGTVEDSEVACSGLGLKMIPLAPEIAIFAGSLRAKHYLGTGRTLSLADSICAAEALHLGVPVATADPVLISVVRAEGGTVIELPQRL